MKNTGFIFLVACLLSMGQALADNVLTVGDVDVPQGGQATLEIGCEFDTEYTAFELQIALPDGLELVTDEDGYPVIEKAFATNHILTGNLLPSNGNYKITCRSMENVSMPTSGALFRVTVQADGSLPVGTELAGSITGIEFTRTADSKGEALDNAGFAVYITEYRTILDEASTTAPEASGGEVDVTLRRTIKADSWSTICLPFSATGEQVKSAFGDDVQLAMFQAWSSEEDDDGAIVGIDVEFALADADDGIEANTPMLIKVSQAVTEATFDGVVIEPEEEPFVQVGKKSSERGWFYGTYAVQTVPEENLFLNSNRFWYSTGATSIMGYRGYFEFRDVLDAYYDASEVKVCLSFVDAEDGISSAPASAQALGDDRCFSLSGQMVSDKRPDAKLPRGIYIKGGRKVIVK